MDSRGKRQGLAVLDWLIVNEECFADRLNGHGIGFRDNDCEGVRRVVDGGFVI